MSTLNQSQLDKLVLEFPFLPSLVNTDLSSGVVSVKVEVADAETLFIRPHFCLPPHYTGSENDKFVGHCHPHAYSIDSTGEIADRMSWGYETPDLFMKDLLYKIHPKPISHLVLVMAYAWWEYIEDWYQKGLETYVGPFSHYEYKVWIFKEPKQGFKTLKAESDLTKNVRIDDLLGISMAQRANLDAKRAYMEVEKVRNWFVYRIARSAWVRINASKSSGMSGRFGETMLYTLCSAGRIMLTFTNGKETFTLVGDESDHMRTGLQSMHCTVDQAKQMVSQVIDNWDPSKLNDDKNVWFG